MRHFIGFDNLMLGNTDLLRLTLHFAISYINKNIGCIHFIFVFSITTSIWLGNKVVPYQYQIFTDQYDFIIIAF